MTTQRPRCGSSVLHAVKEVGKRRLRRRTASWASAGPNKSSVGRREAGVLIASRGATLWIVLLRLSVVSPYRSTGRVATADGSSSNEGAVCKAFARAGGDEEALRISVASKKLLVNSDLPFLPMSE